MPSTNYALFFGDVPILDFANQEMTANFGRAPYFDEFIFLSELLFSSTLLVNPVPTASGWVDKSGSASDTTVEPAPIARRPMLDTAGDADLAINPVPVIVDVLYKLWLATADLVVDPVPIVTGALNPARITLDPVPAAAGRVTSFRTAALTVVPDPLAVGLTVDFATAPLVISPIPVAVAFGTLYKAATATAITRTVAATAGGSMKTSSANPVVVTPEPMANSHNTISYLSTPMSGLVGGGSAPVILVYVTPSGESVTRSSDGSSGRNASSAFI